MNNNNQKFAQAILDVLSTIPESFHEELEEELAQIHNAALAILEG